MRELYGTWAKTRNNVFRKIFVYRRSESVKDVICCLDRVNFRYLLLLRSVKFYKRLYLKSGLLHDIFWSFMIFNCDDWMRTVFITLHKAISRGLTCCPSSTTMCWVMHDIVWCVSLYISIIFCLCLPDWRINVFIISTHFSFIETVMDTSIFAIRLST